MSPYSFIDQVKSNILKGVPFGHLGCSLDLERLFRTFWSVRVDWIVFFSEKSSKNNENSGDRFHTASTNTRCRNFLKRFDLLDWAQTKLLWSQNVPKNHQYLSFYLVWAKTIRCSFALHQFERNGMDRSHWIAAYFSGSFQKISTKRCKTFTP